MQTEDPIYEPKPGDEPSGELDKLRQELEQAKSKHLHTVAEYQTAQRRAIQNEQVAKQQGIASVAQSVAGVIDHFDVALNQDLSRATPEQIVEGVRAIREELIKVLQQHGVRLIAPAKGELFVPQRHEAIMQQAAQGVHPGHIVSVLQPGYALELPGGGERVLRPAKVAVAPGES